MIVWFQCPKCGLHQLIPKLVPWVRVYLGDETWDWCRGCGREYAIRVTNVRDDEGTLFTARLTFRGRRWRLAPPSANRKLRRGALRSVVVQTVQVVKVRRPEPNSA